MPAYWTDPITQRHAPRHGHLCACGAVLTCHCELDKCAVPRAWECPTCELDRLDHQLDHSPTQEQTHHEKH